MFSLLSCLVGLFLGWSVGANDSANMFGTAVGSRMVRFRTAALLIGSFVIVGALAQGHAGIDTVQALSPQTAQTALICAFAAAVAMTLMSALRIPVSSSQMVLSAVFGVGAVRGEIHLGGMLKVLVCWVASPLAAMLAAVLLHRGLGWCLRRARPGVFALDPLLRAGLVVCGAYGAYALGANGVAVVCGVFVGEATGLSARAGALLGGISIALGAFTFSRPVMMTVGKGVIPLDALSAFVAVLALALTVHLFAVIGVPVSSSQAVVGALLGIGLNKGLHVVKFRTLAKVVSWWLVSPLAAAGLAVLIYLAV